MTISYKLGKKVVIRIIRMSRFTVNHHHQHHQNERFSSWPRLSWLIDRLPRAMDALQSGQLIVSYWRKWKLRFFVCTELGMSYSSLRCVRMTQPNYGIWSFSRNPALNYFEVLFVVGKTRFTGKVICKTMWSRPSLMFQGVTGKKAWFHDALVTKFPFLQW